MANSRVQQIVRQFSENGMKLLLEHPANVRDLLRIAGAEWIDLIDVDRLAPVQTTFVERDYRHVESDVVLTAPLRQRRTVRGGRSALIYILIEHQSAPDRLMPLRMLEYVVQIFKFQQRQWSGAGRSPARLRFGPVLPIVFYTGTRRWKSVGRLVDLVESGERFERVLPAIEPLFVNLPELEPDLLEGHGGAFGATLRLVQQRRARPGEFAALLGRMVRHLESLSSAERLRWLELLSYVHALVYHERSAEELPPLQRIIETSVQTDEHRREITGMGKSAAEILRESGLEQGLEQGLAQGRKLGLEQGRKEGAVAARRERLLRSLRLRFENVSAEIAARVEATNDVRQLDEWLDRILTADSLDEMQIDATAE